MNQFEYFKSLTADTKKINEKFDKFYKGAKVNVKVLEQEGYFQDLFSTVMTLTGDLKFIGDGKQYDVIEMPGIAMQPYFERECVITLEGIEIPCRVITYLSGRTFKHDDLIINKSNLKPLFEKIDEDTYNINGEFNYEGHRYSIETEIIK